MIQIPVYTLRAKLKAAALVAGIALALVAVLDLSGFLEPYALKTTDLMFRRLPLAPASLDVAVIAIEQADLDFFREQGLGWPWPRELYAPIINFCRRGGAKALIFDMLFTEGSTFGPADDETLARAAREWGRVILPFFLSQTPKETSPASAELLNKTALAISGPPPIFPRKYQSLLPPIPPLQEAARGLGNVESAPDADGTFRRLPVVVPFQERWLPSLAFAAFLLSRPAEPWEFRGGDLVQGAFRVPLDGRGSVLLKYRGPSRSHSRYGAANIIQSEIRLQHAQAPLIPPEVCKDRWIFLGATAPGLLDLKPSPLAPVYPGVEMHATLLDNLLQGDFLRPCPGWLTWLWAGLLTVAVSVVVLLASRLAVVLSALVLLAGLHIGLVAALFGQGWLMEAVAPAAALVMAFGLAAAFSYATEGRQKLAIRTMFSRYMSEEVIRHLLEHPEKVRLGGERRRLTLFFSDLAGFTSLSERLSPEQVVQVLNEYLSAMTEIILAEQGTVDKYEGDAIMAFWGAPLPLEDQAVRACRAALRQQAALVELNRLFQAKGWPQLHCRIGLHTGEAVVGNLGSRKRFDYTVIGDTVNLASRLEGLNKFYGTGILASDATVAECRGAIEFVELDRVAVKGKETAVAVYTPLGLTGELSAAQERFREAFQRGLALYRQADFAQALAAFEEAQAHWPDCPPCRELQHRCQKWRQAPPGPDWQAIFRPESK